MNAAHLSVDVVVTWAGSVLAVERLAPGEAFTVGPRGTFCCDHPSIPEPAFAVVSHGPGAARVRTAPGMRLLKDGALVDAGILDLMPGQGSARLELGALAFELRFAAAAPAAPSAAARDRRFLLASSSALVLQACLVAVLVLSRSPASSVSPLPTRATARALFSAPRPDRSPLPRAGEAPSSTPRAAEHAARTQDAAEDGAEDAARDEAQGARQAARRARPEPGARELVRGALAALGLQAGGIPTAPGLAGGLDGLQGATGAELGAEGLAARPIGPGGGGRTVAGPALWAHGPVAPRVGDEPWLIARERRAPVVVIDRDFAPVDGLGRDEIQRVMARALPRIKHCYEQELGAAPDLEGKVSATFTVAGSGAVAAVQSAHTLARPAVASCVERIIRTLSFPPPQGGGQVVVTYPFVFTVAGD